MLKKRLMLLMGSCSRRRSQNLILRSFPAVTMKLLGRKQIVSLTFQFLSRGKAPPSARCSRKRIEGKVGLDWLRRGRGQQDRWHSVTGNQEATLCRQPAANRYCLASSATARLSAANPWRLATEGKWLSPTSLTAHSMDTHLFALHHWMLRTA